MSDLDKKIDELFAVLNKQKEAVAEAELESKKKWITNCSFPSVFGNTGPINIQTQSVESLVGLFADLLTHKQSTTKAAIDLGIPVAEDYNKWGGFSVDDWAEDFRTRIAKLQLASKKQELAALEKRLDAIVSPEQRRMYELAEITKSLGV